jgi:drug/metabolite transporter (DMT)-like permease
LKSKGNIIFWAIIACLLWSIAYAGIKIGLQYDTPFHFAGVRFIISRLMILPFTVKPAVLSWLIIPDEHPEWITISGMVIITASLIMFYRSTKKIPAIQENSILL